MLKKYEHNIIEKKYHKLWEEEGYFKAGDLSKKPFCITIPPPNVTGDLHLGHAWNTTLQDIIVRYKRMDGFDVLWLPGMDHAGIATQARVDAKLRDMGLKPREMKREEWLIYAWEWKDKYADNIKKQWSKLGLSLDYTKERFTLDDGLNRAVNEVFVHLYEKGLIYRGERIINWDPLQMTALSNEEVIDKEEVGYFYYLKYFLENKKDYLTIATTRPETLFGDVAVAVNPNDNRYKHLIGKKVILPIVEKLIPIIADEHADLEKGTGAVKITPAHDANDFEVGNRHDLERIVVINLDGTMNDLALEYKGLDRFKCRDEVVLKLQQLDLIEKIEEIEHIIGYSERSKVVVEPILSKQWFVKMRPLADRVLREQKKETKVNFYPSRFERILIHWMEISYDWCISRQLWWGHRIPAWYKDDQIFVGHTSPQEEGWVQDEDVLDTWFSSALWPFSTLGWPEDNNLLKRYYPNDVLVTGYDIIPFWVCRMVFQGLEFLDNRPFDNCLIHGLIRDKEGQKMSKSLGNGIDPNDVINDYGADSLRFFLATSTAPGQDLRFDLEKVASTWNFVNKLWNASRFVLMNLEDYQEEKLEVTKLNDLDKWILHKQNQLIKDVRKHMEVYEFNFVGQQLYSFIWNDFCDWYIELAKVNMNKQTKNVLVFVLKNVLKMLHPFMPFVTEEIYSKLSNSSIMISDYPIYNDDYKFEEEIKEVNELLEIITKIRNIKNEKKINQKIYIMNELNAKKKYLIIDNQLVLEKLTKSEVITEYNQELSWIEEKFVFGSVKIGYKGQAIIEDIEQLKEQYNNLMVSIKRRKTLLNNENYLYNAPANIVDLERRKLLEEKIRLEQLTKKIEKES